MSSFFLMISFHLFFLLTSQRIRYFDLPLKDDLPYFVTRIDAHAHKHANKTVATNIHITAVKYKAKKRVIRNVSNQNKRVFNY